MMTYTTMSELSLVDEEKWITAFVEVCCEPFVHEYARRRL
jgi:hypothetical protein